MAGPVPQPIIEDVALREGFRVRTYRYGPPPGSGVAVLVCANGGPGLPCDYLRDPHARLASGDLTVIAWDQLGCGASDRPEDRSLWTVTRYVDELEQIRAALGIGRFHLLGHSWGTWLGTEYCLTHPDRVLSYIIADGANDIPHLVAELHRLRDALGSETVTMMQRHEAEGTLDHPEYQAAITILNHRHVCRLDVWPDSLKRSIQDWNMGPYVTMQGPNEFTYTGNMRDWNRIPDLHRLALPCLVLAGAHDELTPACAMRMHLALPDSRIRIFPNSSHMPFYEEPEAYFDTVAAFLRSAGAAR